MNWPTSQDYNEAVQDPATSFSDPALKGGQVVVNAMGLPVPRSGNFADVYQFTGADGKSWALKCFTRKVAGLRERYARIDEHLAGAKLPFTVGFGFLEKGVRVRGEWYPLLKMEWVEGFTLNDFVARNLGKPDLLHRLVQMWAKLAGRLRDANLAHADLQHGNVLLVPGATPQKLGLKLIDYDGMWVPALAGTHSGEVGHPNFQHPVRLKEKLYSGDVDRFPHLVIAAGLRAALVGGKPVWEKFDNEDNLLFKEADFRDPGRAPVFKALWDLNDPVLRTLVGHIALSASQPLRKTPWLDEVLFQEGGPKLTADEERRVCDLLGVTAKAPAGATAAPPAAVEQEFNVFQFLDDDEGPKSSVAAGSGRRAIPRRRVPPKKSKAPLLVGGGLAAVLLIGGVVAAVALTNKNKDRPTETAQARPDERPKSPGDDKPRPPGKDPNDPPVKPVNDDRALAFSDRGYLELEKTRGLVSLNNNFTAEIWVRWPAGYQHPLTIMGDEAWPGMGTPLSVTRPCGWVLRTSAPRAGEQRTIEFAAGATEGEWFSVLSAPVNAPGGEWHHLAVSKSGPTVRVFLDGNQVAERSTEGVRLIGCPTDLYLGIRKDGYAERWFEGEVKGFRLSNRGRYTAPFKPEEKLAKDAGTEVLLDFPNGTDELVPDISGKGHNGVPIGLRWTDRPNTPAPPPPSAGPPGLVSGIAALPGGRDFLFVRQNDPALYSTVNGSARRPREVGRSGSPIRVVAVTPDGSKAVTGSEDGTVGVWSLPEHTGAPAAGGPQMKQRIASFKKIDTFNGRWSLDAYQEGIVVHDFERKLDATIPVGEPGRPVKGAFAGNLKKNAKLAEQLGRAMTDEINLYDGDLIVQVFEGGVQFFSKTVDKTWFGWHAKRKPAADGGPGAAQRADYVWIDDALPPGARPSLTDPGAAAWEFVGADAGPVHTGQKAVRIAATGARQNVFADARPALRVGASDVLFAYVYLDPKNPPDEIMLQWAGHGWQRGGFRRAYWGANKLRWGRDGSPQLKSMGPLPEAGKWVRLEVKIDDLDIQPGAAISSLALTQFGGTAYWDAIGVNTATPQGPAVPAAAAQPRRTDEVWLDDALPAGGKPSIGGTNVDCTFIDKNDGPVHSGEKAVRLTADGLQQIVIEGINAELRVDARDVLFAYVYVDPKNPPEEIMLQWLGPNWEPLDYRRYYWGTKKTPWPGKAMGDLPEAGKWVRLEMKIDDAGVKPGATVDRFALTQVGGTVYWDTIGVSRAPSEGPGAPGLKTLKGHTGMVVACAVSPDGSRAVTLGSDRQLCEWDLAGAKLVRKFEVPDARAVAFLPDGKSVLIGTEGESAGVWDLETKTRTKEVAGHAVPVRAVCVSPRGDMAWTAGEDGEIRSWAVPEFRQLGAFSNEQKPVAALAVSDDGQVLAAAGPDGWVRYFSGRTGRSLGGGGGRLSILAVAILPGGTKLAAAWGREPVVADLPRPRETGNVPSLPPSTGSSVLKLLQTVEAPGGQVHRMGYSPDGKHLWMSGPDSMTVADGATGRAIKTWAVEGNDVSYAAFGPGTQLYVVHTLGRFEAWDWQKGERVHEYDATGQRGPRAAAVWPLPTPNRLLVTTYNPPAVLIWDAAKWKEVERFTPYGKENLSHAAPFPGGNRFVAVVGGEPSGTQLVVWDVAQRKEVLRLDGSNVKRPYRLEVSPNGRWIVGHTGFADDHRLIVWNARTGKVTHTIPGIKTGAVGGGFSANGDRYVYPGEKGRWLVINLTDGKTADETSGRFGALQVAGAPTANLLASFDADGKIRIWRFDPDAKGTAPASTPNPKTPAPSPPAEAGGLVKELELPDPVTACAVSTDGKRAYVGTSKGTVHVVDAATGQEVGKPFEVSKAGVIHMVFVPKYIHPSNGAAIPDRLHLLDADRHLIAIDADKGTKVRDVDLGKAGVQTLSATARLAITPFESHVMVFDPDQAKAYSWASGRWSQASIPAALHNPPFNESTRAVGYAPDGSVGAAVAARKLIVWKSRGTKEARTIDLPFSARWVGVSADAGAVAASDGVRLQAWKSESGVEALNARDPHGPFGTYVAAATPGGLVTAGSDRWLRVWDLKAGKAGPRFRLDRAPAGIAVSADGRRAVVWDEEGSKIGLWAIPDLKGK